MRCALLVSGHSRTWRRLRGNAKQLMVQLRRLGSCDVFLHSWVEDRDQAALRKFLRPVDSVVTPHGPLPHLNEHQRRAHNQRIGVRHAWDLCASSPMTYDVVMRHRPDVYVKVKVLKQKPMTLVVGGRSQYYLQEGQRSVDDYVCDAHAYGSYDAMRWYCCADEVIIDKSLTPEETMALWLKEHSVNVRVDENYLRCLHREQSKNIWLGRIPEGR